LAKQPTVPSNAARIFDVWGLARSKFFTVVVLVITAILVLMEARYNIDLLSTISDPTASREVVGGLSQRGKLLAAFGITWAVARVLLTAIRPFALGLTVFLGLAFGVYHGIDTIYTYAIASLKPEVKVKGFALFSYRRDLLTEKLIDPDLPLPKNEPVIGKIFMGAFPMVLLDERYMVPVQVMLEVQANYKSKEVLAKAENEWPRYDAGMSEILRKYDEFIAESRKVTDPAAGEDDWRKYAAKMAYIRSKYGEFIAESRKVTDPAAGEDDWRKYAAQMAHIRSKHDEFIDGSRKAAAYGARGTSVFRERSGGFSPNPNLSLQGFVNMIRAANHPEGEKMRREEGRQLGQRANGTPVYGRDMPYFMGHAEFLRWVGDLRRDSFAAKGFKPDPKLTRDGFVDMLRASRHPEGEKMRREEGRQLGQRANGTPVYVRDMPYFLGRDEFLRWVGDLRRDSFAARGFKPDPKLTRDGFVDMLRASDTKDGAKIREMDATVLGRRPDGSTVTLRELPYFLDRSAYLHWFASQAEAVKNSVLPTAETVEKFKDIQDVNSAVFLPPMAIITSLTSATTNALSLVIVLVGLALTRVSATRSAGAAVLKFSSAIMIILFAVALYLMPAHVFRPDTPLYDLETSLHETVGFPGKIWSRLSNLQKLILRG